jgi:hypothetical protein
MSAVSEWIVREYFETLGFLVQQPRKYGVTSRPKRPEEEIDLLIIKPGAQQKLTDEIVWSSEDLKHVARAIVGVRGWHTDRFSPAVLETSPEIFRFAEEESVRRVSRALGEGGVAKILCLPGLSSADDLKKRSLEMLKLKGIDGIISFPTMLRELIDRTEVSKNYEKSDLLQILRILKNYDLLKDPQLELFRRKKR